MTNKGCDFFLFIDYAKINQTYLEDGEIMKDHIQTILNVCFAVCITAFIYQNNSLKDDVKTLKGYAQLDTDKAWDEIDKLKKDFSELNSQHNLTRVLIDEWADLLDDEMNQRMTNTKNLDTAQENFTILFKDRDKLIMQSKSTSKNLNDVIDRVNLIVNTLKN
jgi:hypothetical protein